MDWFQNLTESNQNLLLKAAITALLFFLLWVIRFIVLGLFLRTNEDLKDRYTWRNGTKYIAVSLGIIGVGIIWVQHIENIATVIGLVSAGLTIALKDPIVNLAGWLFILIRKPFDVGDRIQVGTHSGDVIDIRIFQFTINEIGNWVDADQSTGRIIHIPNGTVFTASQVNYTQGFSHIWNEMNVMVTFESDWQKARSILHKIISTRSENLNEQAKKDLRKASRKYMIFYNKLDPIVYTTVKESGVVLSIRYLCRPHRRRGTENEIWEDILTEFKKAKDIDFAYPTQRIFLNPQEGKEGTKPN
jgi:small-conductance mechanosensitive channel